MSMQAFSFMKIDAFQNVIHKNMFYEALREIFMLDMSKRYGRSLWLIIFF